MGLIKFQPSRKAGNVFEVRNMDIQAAATFSEGAPLQRDATPSDVEEHAGGATVTGIIGLAMVGATAGVPNAKGGTAYGTTVPVAIANLATEYIGTLINAGTVVTPDSANIGVNYGMIEVSNEWYVDEADTTNVVLTVTGILPDINCVLFRWISTAIAD